MVRILEKIYNNILYNTPTPAPETGGILGSLNGIVTRYIPDNGANKGRVGKYVPSISYLNDQIRLCHHADASQRVGVLIPGSIVQEYFKAKRKPILFTSDFTIKGERQYV